MLQLLCRLRSCSHLPVNLGSCRRPWPCKLRPSGNNIAKNSRLQHVRLAPICSGEKRQAMSGPSILNRASHKYHVMVPVFVF